MRIYLYLLAGITSALIGWNLGQIFLTYFGFLQQFPEVVLFPCVAISLAIGMVLNEIFISNPTRPKRSFYKARVPLVIALGLGLLAGLIAGGISQILFLPSISIPTPIVRSLGWLLIGASVGLAEGLTWRWHSTEAGDRKRARHRLIVSLAGGIIASLFAALLFKLDGSSLIELPSSLKAIEDPIGFAILGLTFGLSNSPSTTIVSSIQRLSLSLLMLGCLTSPSWGKTNEVEIIGKPVVKDDRVTVRVKVKDELEKPVMGLNYTNFNLEVDEEEVELKNKDWKSPEETIPPPAWIVVLLDFSGSMNQPDSSGSTKLQGAVKAIRKFTQLSAARGGNTQIAIVPFGDSGGNCQGYPVNKQTLDKFFSAGDFKLQNYLDYLAGLTPCAATNLYDPLEEAVRFLENQQDTRFHLPEESKAPEPRLSVVLLSDGYHNKPNEERDFQRLIGLLQSKSEIAVHTLGYGLTPEELAKKYKVVSRRATRADLGSGKIPAEEFVDREKLAQIAQVTGGIAEFSGNAQDIAESLQVFLNSLLGEYEITYTHPNAERGSKHKVSVAANSVSSKPESYIVAVFGRSLSRPIRISIFFSTLLLLGLGGILPFGIWAKKLKYEGMDD